MKPKAIYFYQYLPPWRIDVFNEIAKHYDLTIVFTNAELEGFTYNRSFLLSKLNNIKTIFLNNGFKIGTRPIRFGIYKIISNIKPDIIFSHEYSPTSILVALYRNFHLLKYKYVITTSVNLKMAEEVKGIKSYFRNYVHKHSDGIIVYSSSVKKWYENKFPKLKVEICPNIQNPKTLIQYRTSFPQIIETYKKKFNLDGKKIMLYIGRLVYVKGLDLLLDAFSRSNTDYVLVIVGEGVLEDSLKRQSENLKIKDRVIFAGGYSGANLYAWYDIANFFILPSRYEPFGAVINEALIYGCPVVASKYIGALEFVSSNNGIIFNPLDKDEFIKTITLSCHSFNEINERKNLMTHSFEEYVKVFNNWGIK